MIPRETVDQILDAARIEEVVGDFVTLKRRGASYVACCPFHNEKTPSFHVTPSKGIYKCFGCGEQGNSVGFLMKHENMTYPEAIAELERSGRDFAVPARWGMDLQTEHERYLAENHFGRPAAPSLWGPKPVTLITRPISP